MAVLEAQEPINVNEYIEGNVTLDELTKQFSDRIDKIVRDNLKYRSKTMIGMSWKECLEWQAKEKAFLDTKDLKPFCEKDRSIYDIMDAIEDTFDDYTEEPFIFNCMDHNEFIEYLENRYPDIQFYEFSEDRVL
jgi:hypothetical protein